MEAGYGSPTLTLHRALVTDCEVGVRFGDSYDWGSTGHITVTASVVTGNHDHNVWNHDLLRGGPRPGAIEVSCSMVDTDGLDGVDGNVAGQATPTADGCLPGATACGAPLGPQSCPW